MKYVVMQMERDNEGRLIKMIPMAVTNDKGTAGSVLARLALQSMEAGFSTSLPLCIIESEMEILC